MTTDKNEIQDMVVGIKVKLVALRIIITERVKGMAKEPGPCCRHHEQWRCLGDRRKLKSELDHLTV